MPYFYIRFHKPHHVFTAPFAATSHATHPVEMLLQGVGGMLGTILIGVFAAPSLGIFSGNGFSDGVSSMGGQLYIQIFGVVVTFLFALVGSWILLKLVDQLVGLRVDDDEETEGLDLVLHDERGYDL